MNQFIYHSVGQGLFYSGNIGDNFNFVYDCGSLNVNSKSKKSAILRYQANNTSGKINILFISHLHADHINGIKELVKGYTIDYVIMPYLTINQRLLLLSSNDSKDYKNFIQNPIKYICEENTKTQIILIKNTNAPLVKDEKLQDMTIDNLLKDKIRMENSDSFYLENETLENHIFIIENTNFTFTQNNWIFDVFYKNISDKKTLGQIRKIGTPQEILDNKHKQIQQIKSLLSSKKQDLNENSLILYHGPLKINENKAQLLTGDYIMKTNYKYLISHFNTIILNSVKYCLVPHHGGVNAWNKNILRNLENCNDYICSYGFLNQYNHPSTNVIYDILRPGKRFISCCDKLSDITINI